MQQTLWFAMRLAVNNLGSSSTGISQPLRALA